MGSCRCDAILTQIVNSSHCELLDWLSCLPVFALADLRALIDAVGLLEEKHVSMIVRCLHNLGPRSPGTVLATVAMHRLRTHHWVDTVVRLRIQTRHVVLLAMTFSRFEPIASNGVVKLYYPIYLGHILTWLIDVEELE